MDEEKTSKSLIYAVLFADRHNLELFVYVSNHFDKYKDVNDNWRLACKHTFSWDDFEAGDIMIIKPYYYEPDNIMLYNVIHDLLFTDLGHTVYFDLTDDKCLENYETEFD